MSIFRMPGWVKQHQYPNKKFSDLSSKEIDDLNEKLKRLSSENPEVSIVIPAWNEENNIFRSLSSLASTNTKLAVEIIVVNNNSTDQTQMVLDRLGVKSEFEILQGISYARQSGLMKAKGRFHLCADSDTLYPPSWIDLMIEPMLKSNEIVGVYGRYSFLPLPNSKRLTLSIYESITGVLVRIRKKKREHLNVLGFNMGFVTEIGVRNGGFHVKQVRKFHNVLGSEDFIEEAEDGRMALNLKKSGKLKLVTHPKARVFTSSRRLAAEGGIVTSFTNRLRLHSTRLLEYFTGPSVNHL
jgi:glycosyltransferase involved in cell wall biosynthesis